MMGRPLKIIVSGDEVASPRTYLLPRWFLAAALLVLVTCAALTAVFYYRYLQLSRDQQELQQLRLANIDQHNTLEQLQARLDSVSGQLAGLQISEARLRQLASLDAPQPEDPPAVGGLSEDAADLDTDALQQQIDRLLREISIRRFSQEQIRNQLNDEVSLSRSTPRGWPAKGWISSYFGKRQSPFSGRTVMHEGLDISASIGTPVMATADGVVAQVSYGGGYGKVVVLDHGYGYRTLFGHNSKILVKSGQYVRRGERIALVGKTGRTTGAHLHYELLFNGVPIDPRKTL